MKYKKIGYEVAYKAVHGDREAQMAVLNFYDGYINALSTAENVCSDGDIRRFVDEDLKATIQTGYLEAIPKCRGMK